MINLFGLNFHLYGLFVGVGMVVALDISERLAKIRQIDKKEVRRLFWWVVLLGVIGARIYHVVDYWERIYSKNLIEVFYVWNGGLGIWGGMFGGIIGLLVFQYFRKMNNLFNWLDIGFVGLPLAQTIGRLGNYFNQELYGKETFLPWGIIINNRRYHPLFAYEGLLTLILFGFLWKLRFKKSGIISGVYLVGYGLIRFFLEWLRPDEIVWRVGGIPMAAIWSLGAIIIGGVIIWKRK
jgi:phosphatidylglycerol:prolipoprotein diacylglycerol transferase